MNGAWERYAGLMGFVVAIASAAIGLCWPTDKVVAPLIGVNAAAVLFALNARIDRRAREDRADFGRIWNVNLDGVSFESLRSVLGEFSRKARDEIRDAAKPPLTGKLALDRARDFLKFDFERIEAICSSKGDRAAEYYCAQFSWARSRPSDRRADSIRRIFIGGPGASEFTVEERQGILLHEMYEDVASIRYIARGHHTLEKYSIPKDFGCALFGTRVLVHTSFDRNKVGQGVALLSPMLASHLSDAFKAVWDDANDFSKSLLDEVRRCTPQIGGCPPTGDLDGAGLREEVIVPHVRDVEAQPSLLPRRPEPKAADREEAAEREDPPIRDAPQGR